MQRRSKSFTGRRPAGSRATRVVSQTKQRRSVKPAAPRAAARTTNARKAAPSARSATPSARRATPGARKTTGARGTMARAAAPTPSRARKGPGPQSGKQTKDHELIRKWAEERQGTPSTVIRTSKGNQPGILRLDFPGFSGKGTLKPITWDEWFRKFDEQNLTFLYQSKTAGGKISRFFKLICGTEK